MEPRISILMAVYNAGPFLREAIESVITQSYPNWELICVNDGSSDNSLEILNEMASCEPRIRVISQQNSGASNARNAALTVSRGQYVCILDADDKLSSDYLEQTLQVAMQDPEYDCVIPELYIWHWQDESLSYSCSDSQCLPEGCDGRKAFELSIPWKIHALALWNGDMLRQIGYRKDNYITSDEVSSRDFFIHSRRVVSSGGRYYYRYNEDSITKKISARPIEKLLTNIQLDELVEKCGLDNENRQRIRTVFFEELVALTMYYFRNRSLFSAVERRRSGAIIQRAYVRSHIRDLRPTNVKTRLKKITLGYSYKTFILICYCVWLIKR